MLYHDDYRQWRSELSDMETKKDPRKKNDLQTASLFLILALLTGLFVFGLKWALFAPTPSASIEASQRP